MTANVYCAVPLLAPTFGPLRWERNVIDVVSLMTMREGSADSSYTPDHSARHERWQLQRAIENSLNDLVQQDIAPQAAAPVVREDRVFVDLVNRRVS